MPDVEVTKVVDGLGFGAGNISHQERKQALGDPELIRNAEAVIASPQIVVPVDVSNDGRQLDDDGCGDGRAVSRVFKGEEIKSRSLNRSKVFGGGATMMTAALIGLNETEGLSVRESFAKGIARLKDKMIGFGAHTDTHAEGGNSGCGAIDKAPQAIRNVLIYENNIRGVINALGVEDKGIDEVFSAYGSYALALDNYAEGYAGKNVVGEIMSNGKIVKELDEDHREMYIVLNEVDGHTVNQQAVREVSGDKVQVFGVDVWRMKAIAERGFESESDRHKAFLSELVYTLGVAATLTKGDLPVYRVSTSPALVAA